MIELLKILLSLSLSGTLLILILFLCKPFYKNKLSRQWQYYIWLIVVARLLLPFTPETSLVGNLFQDMDSAAVRSSAGGQANGSLLPDTDFTKHEVYSPNQADTVTQNSAELEKTLTQRVLETPTQHIWLICVLIWLMVAIGLLIRKVTIYQSFVKYIKAGRIEVKDMKLWEQLGQLVEQAGVKRTVELYTNNLISSPLLIGFLHPCIVLPSEELSDSDLKNTLLHELTHYKRRDMFYKWLVQITICFHWFNPFVYLMSKEINQACEFSCDETIIKKFDKQAQQAYGTTLLHALKQGGQYKNALASVTLNESTKILKERLDAIMNFRKKTQLCIAASIALILVMCFGAIAIGAYPFNVKQKEQNDTTKDSKEKVSNPYSAYSQYGISYDEKTDSLFYNQDRIRYFEDNSIFYNGDGTTKGSFTFHTDKAGEGKIDIYTVRNSQNELTGIRIATEEEFIGNSLNYTSILHNIADYKEYGVTTDMAGYLYFEGSLVRELYDPVTETLIQRSRGVSYPEDSIDIEAVYDNGQLLGFKIISQEEYDMHTQKRIEAVQDYWVEEQNQRN